MKIKVLIIEDDIQLNTTVSNFLKDNGYILIRVHQYKYSKSYWQADHFKVAGKDKEISSNHFSTHSLKLG